VDSEGDFYTVDEVAIVRRLRFANVKIGQEREPLCNSGTPMQSPKVVP